MPLKPAELQVCNTQGCAECRCDQGHFMGIAANWSQTCNKSNLVEIGIRYSYQNLLFRCYTHEQIPFVGIESSPIQYGGYKYWRKSDKCHVVWYHNNAWESRICREPI